MTTKRFATALLLFALAFAPIPVHSQSTWSSTSPSSGGGGSSSVDGPSVTVKGSDEAVLNSTTLQDDDDFSFAVTAGNTYFVEIVGLVSSATAADFKHAWTVPAGTTGWHSGSRLRTNATNSAGDREGDASFTLTTSIASGAGGLADAAHIAIRAVFVVTTAGTVQFQWAQEVATASNTTLESGTTMFVWTSAT